MISVNFINKTSTSIDQSGVTDAIKKVLLENGYKSDTEVSVAIVHHDEIVDLAMRYMNETKEEAMDHPVLSFLKDEVEHEFIYPPDEINYLGEIIISLEKSEEKAEEDKKSLQEIVEHWADHAALHLCGIHHD